MATTIIVHLSAGCPDLPWAVSVDDSTVTVMLESDIDAHLEMTKVVPCTTMLSRPGRLAAWTFARDTLSSIVTMSHGARVQDVEATFRALEDAYRKVQDVDAILNGCAPANLVASPRERVTN